MSTDPSIECIQGAMRQLLRELKSAVRSESNARKGSEESFESGKLQALAFALQVLLNQVERAELSGQVGKVAIESKRVLEDLGLGDFGL